MKIGTGIDTHPPVRILSGVLQFEVYFSSDLELYISGEERKRYHFTTTMRKSPSAMPICEMEALSS